MSVLTVERMGLAYLFGLAHPSRTYVDPELPREVANYVPPRDWGALLRAATTTAVHIPGADRSCPDCDVLWKAADPCWSCQTQPTGGTWC